MLEAGIVAPPGAVRARALRLTLVKPPAGACTTTCVSTVSPRAPERLMEEVVPGTSASPTRLRLGDTHTGNAVGLVTVGVAGLLVAFPTELLTSTVTCAPLSELVVPGVLHVEESPPLTPLHSFL